MTELYINKWWGSYIGGCDDSLLLLDYFGQKDTGHFNLREVLEDIHLYSLLKSKDLGNGDLYFEVSKDYAPHFDMAIDV